MAIIQDIGHLILPVDEMSKALAFYRDLLGFQVVGKGSPVWTVIEVSGGKSLCGARRNSPRSRTVPIEKTPRSSSTWRTSRKRPASSNRMASG